MAPRPQSERGIALIMVLLVITLMMILVLEFTYTVQVETHISRNSLNSLQATYLARSGINILAGALIKDSDRLVDPGEEDEWRAFSLGGCRNILENEESIPPTWQLCGRIVDESAKININFTRPLAVPQQAAQTQGQSQGQRDCVPAKPATEPYCWRAALVNLGEPFGLDDTRLEDLDSYWATKGVQPTRLGQPPPPSAEFGSLEEATAAFPQLLADRSAFDQLRKYVTALPGVKVRKINVNTVRPEVLRAILKAYGSKVEADDVRQRCNPATPCKSADLGQAFAGDTNAARVFDVQTRSGVFRLETSAVVNGVAKTVRALVLREAGGPLPNGPPGAVRWRLTYLDWQKESGASVTHESGDDDGESLDDADNSDNNRG